LTAIVSGLEKIGEANPIFQQTRLLRQRARVASKRPELQPNSTEKQTNKEMLDKKGKQ
jgi:hypothetical protein